MKFLPTRLRGVLIVEPDVYRDSRGHFLETYQFEKYKAGGITDVFVQDNASHSVRNTLRGLHFQWKNPQAKLVRVLSGDVFDVVVDLRPASPTFKMWESVRLTSENFRQLYIPPGFAHGFLVLSDQADFEYKCSAFYDASDEGAIRWNDPDLGIDWPVKEPVVSAKDTAAPLLKDILGRLK